MTTASRPSCDRTRALLSRKLDGALSELELRAVVAHTARCAQCREFEANSRWFTDELRSAPMIPLAEPVMVAAARRRIPMRIAANLASTAALLVVTIGGLSLTVDWSAGPQDDRARASASTMDASFGDSVLREFRRDALRSRHLRILPEADPPNGVKPALISDNA